MLGAVIKTSVQLARENLGFTGDRMIENPYLTEHIRRGVGAIADTFFPRGGEIEWSAQDANVEQYMMNNLRNMPPKQANMMSIAMIAYEYIVPKLYGHLHSFSEMSQEEREAMFEEISHSSIFPIRMLTMSLRMFFSFGYLADEKVLRDMGFFKQHNYPRDVRDIEIVENFLEYADKVAALEAEDTGENAGDTGFVKFAPLKQESAQP